MKMIGLPILGSFSGLVWVILAQQSEDQSETASMKESMSQMMKEKQSDKDGMHGIGRHEWDDGMMKMMEQCTAMMRSVHPDGGGAKDDREQQSRGSRGVKPLLWYSRCYPR